MLAAAVRLLKTSSHQNHHQPFCHFLHLFFFLFLLFRSLAVSDKEIDALFKFKDSLDNTQAIQNWQRGSNPCNWDGINCGHGSIIALAFANQNLSGKIDIDALSALPALRNINFNHNKFSGPLPEFSRLDGVKGLYLGWNNFTGEIPPDFFAAMLSLRKLYLSGNHFFGKIPNSVAKIHSLKELHMEDNQFSGPIPADLGKSHIFSLNMSNNKLEGEIPITLSKFDAAAFQGNVGLCGKQLGKECNTQNANAEPMNKEHKDGPLYSNPGTTHNEEKKSGPVKWVFLCIMIAVFLLTIVFKVKSKQQEKFQVLVKENAEDTVHVEISRNKSKRSDGSISNRKGSESSSKRYSFRQGLSMKASNDLVMVNEETPAFGLSDLMKAAAEVLGNGALGSAYMAKMANGISVVVKRLKETNKMGKDVFDAEVRKFGRLKHPNILTPLAYRFRKEEKLLVSRFIPKGSLLYLLHGDRGISHAELTWPTRFKIIQGIATGLDFLHKEYPSHGLPHGNLKSSNILLDSYYEPLLTDYALYPLVNNTAAAQSLFAYKSPEAILYQQVSPKSDVYCLGIVILEIISGKFPSQYLNNQNGGTDVVEWVRSAISEKRESELIDPELATAKDYMGQMEKLIHIAVACTESEQSKRIDMQEVIKKIEQIQY